MSQGTHSSVSGPVYPQIPISNLVYFHKSVHTRNNESSWSTQQAVSPGAVANFSFSDDQRKSFLSSYHPKLNHGVAHVICNNASHRLGPFPTSISELPNKHKKIHGCNCNATTSPEASGCIPRRVSSFSTIQSSPFHQYRRIPLANFHSPVSEFLVSS